MKDLKPKYEISMQNPSLTYSRKEKQEIKILRVIIILCLFFVAFNTFFNAYFHATTVEGQSMYPNINKQGTEFLSATLEKSDKAYYVLTTNVNRGDIIIAMHGAVPVIKRLLALEGDTVEIFYENSVYGIKVNGEIIDEPYIFSNSGMSETYNGFLNLKTYNPNVHQQDFSSYFNGNILTVPENCIFYLGDNRANSSDCSLYGPNSKDNLVAKVAFIVPYGQTVLQMLWHNFCSFLGI